MSSNKLNLKIGDKIKIGEKYVTELGIFKTGEIITLVEGYFEYDNGLYCETQTAPSIWNEDEKDYDSIYHLFGNDLEYFMDCEVLLTNEANDKPSVATVDDSSTDADKKIIEKEPVIQSPVVIHEIIPDRASFDRILEEKNKEIYYWQKRCEAAERCIEVMIFDDEKTFTPLHRQWFELKSQTP